MGELARIYLKRVSIAAIIWLTGLTVRIVRINWNIIEELERDGQPYLLGVWHNNILFFIYFLGPYRYPVMISRSRDGADINWVAERFGFLGVRGSPSAGASGALRQALRLLSQGRPVIVTPDGPRGPRYEVKPGIAGLARKRRVPVVPICYSAPRRWETRSWDRAKLPKPFSKVTVLVGNPLWLIDPDADEEADRRRVEEAMRKLVRLAEAYTGADATFPDPVLMK